MVTLQNAAEAAKVLAKFLQKISGINVWSRHGHCWECKDCFRQACETWIPTKPYLGLPSDAIFTRVWFHFFLRPLLFALAGIEQAQTFIAGLAQRVDNRIELLYFYRGRHFDGLVYIFSSQGISHIKASPASNCYVELPEGATPILAGTPVKVTAV